MHPVTNQVEIPLGQVEDALCQRAVPGFTGSVIVHIKVLPTAAFEVEFRYETDTVLQLQKKQDPEMAVITNARVASVRRALAENANLFRIGTPLHAIRCHFENGELRKMHAKEVE